jgi:hypothetical protein
MSTGEPARAAVHGRRPAHRTAPVAAIVVALAALVGAVAHQSDAASSSGGPEAFVAGGARPSFVTSAESGRPTSAAPPPTGGGARSDGRGIDDGAVPDGVTVFDQGIPAVVRLDPGLLDALRRAAARSAADGVFVVVNSGWRSPAYQQRLLDEAVARYGSREEAARWVATPDTSAHVSGDAIDVGPASAATWLARHGAAYGLCRIYGNEPWHFELRPGAARQGCPAPYADPTHDPRLQD